MGFSFLGTAAHAIGNVAHGNSAPGGGVFGFLDKHVVQPAAQQVTQGVENLYNSPVVGGARLAVANATGNPLAAENASQGLKKSFGEIGAELRDPNTLASTFAGEGSTTKGSALRSLAKTTTAEDAKSLLIKQGVDEATAHQIAPQIALSKDPHIINNILVEAHNPQPAAISQPTPAPRPAPISDVRAPEAPGNGTNEAINSHLQTLRNAETTGPELQQAIEGLRQTHVQRDTQALSDQAKAAVDKDYTGSLTKLLTNENPSDKDVAVAAHLVTRAQDEAKAARDSGDNATADAKMAEAVNIADRTDKILREAGRTAQAGSIIARLTPEGQLQFAARKIRQVREANPQNITKENKTAAQIKDTVEGSVPQLDRQTVGGVIKDISNDQQKLDLGGLEGGAQAAENTGTRLAKNVEAAATPQIKKKADTLVAELTKKVKQEYIDNPAPVKRSPTAVLREVFGRNDEAKEAYPLAQKILRDKYANVPTMQKALDKFFGSKLDIPAASSTVDSAIREQLKTNGVRIADVIHKSLTTQEATVKNVTNDLVKEGFDQASATKLAEEVAKRLNKQVADAKISKLQQLSQEAKKGAQSTYLDKINKLSNLGALDDSDYLHLARAKLKLPQLTPELAEKIHGLSQQLQSLPEGHDKYALVREIQRTVAEGIPLSKRELAKEIIGLPRTLLASGDFSFGGRQGLAYLTSHPIRFADGWPKQFEYFKQAFAGKDSEAYDAMMADIRQHPDYHLLESSPAHLLEISGHETNLKNENYISSDLAEKFPVIGRLVRASNYAYTGLSNYLRANEFYAQLEHLRYAGIEPDKFTIDQLGEQISTSLGRGGKPGGFVEKHGGFLSTSLFSPRLLASRVNILNPAYYIRLKGPARREALRTLIGLSAFAVGSLALAKQAGADVSVDPRSADFGKVRIGDTRLDLLAGFSQYIRVGTQLISGQKINSQTGAETEVGKGFAGSRLDIASNFAQGKENPAVSFVTTFLKGKDVSGNSIYNVKGVSSQVLQRFVPLLAQDIWDLQTHPDAVGGSTAGKVAAPFASLFGVGLQTYGAQDNPISTKEKDYITNLKKSGADKETIQANTAFFQDLKAASGTRLNVNSAIDEAIKNGDLPKAQKLADDYNTALAKGIADWNKKYGKYATPDLQTTYTRQKIHLTSASIASRTRSIKNTKPY